jgi:hypothetical protein
VRAAEAAGDGGGHVEASVMRFALRTLHEIAEAPSAYRGALQALNVWVKKAAFVDPAALEAPPGGPAPRTGEIHWEGAVLCAELCAQLRERAQAAEARAERATGREGQRRRRSDRGGAAEAMAPEAGGADGEAALGAAPGGGQGPPARGILGGSRAGAAPSSERASGGISRVSSVCAPAARWASCAARSELRASCARRGR